MIRAEKILLMGALRSVLKDGRIGGQAFACTSLADYLSSVGWVVLGLDTSRDSIRSKGLLSRVPAVLLRMLRFIVLMTFQRPAVVLIFASAGIGFIEKLILVWVGERLGAVTFLFPRSGALREELTVHDGRRRFLRRVIKGDAVLLCQSESWKEFFLQCGVPLGNTLVIENWLPPECFVPENAVVASSDGSRFVIGYLGRIEREKGVFDLVAAVDIVRKEIPGVMLRIYGDGSSADDLHAFVRQRGLNDCVEFKGWLSSDLKSAALREVDLLAFCSHSEGYPNSVLEAVALKVPVVCTRVGAVEDFLKDGVSACLVDCRDPAALAEGVFRMQRNPAMRTEFAENAYRRAAVVNSISSAVDHLIKELSSRRGVGSGG